MLENSIFNIRPRKPANIVITKKKLVMGLIIMLMFFTILKIHRAGSLDKELFSTKMALVLVLAKDLNDDETLNKAFTNNGFCGWQAVDEAGKTTSSKDFENTSKQGRLIKQDINRDGVKTNMSICVTSLNSIDSSVKRQVFGILVLAAIIIFIIYSTKFLDDEEDDNKKDGNSKIQNT